MDRIAYRDGCPYLCIEMGRSNCNALRWEEQNWILRMTQGEFICALADTVHLWPNQIPANYRRAVLAGMEAARFNPYAFWDRLDPCIPIPLPNEDSATVDLMWNRVVVSIRISTFAVIAASYIAANPALPTQGLRGSAAFASVWSSVIQELKRSVEWTA